MTLRIQLCTFSTAMVHSQATKHTTTQTVMSSSTGVSATTPPQIPTQVTDKSIDPHSLSHVENNQTQEILIDSFDLSAQGAGDAEPEFPMLELSRLDEMISRPRWVVPVLPKGELEVLLDAAIRLSKEGNPVEWLETEHCVIVSETDVKT